MNSCTLYELNEFIRRVLALNLPESLWVSCEISQVNLSRGHYFLGLVQKADDSDELIAQAEAVVWERTARQLRRQLGADFDALLQDGVEMRLRARVDFNERYGLKLVVEDIDPSYTLGKLEQLRRQTIQRLQDLDLLERNRQRPLPPVLQRIAVLSSERAAGLQDFLGQLDGNPYGYRFHSRLFATAVQGRQVDQELRHQLRQVQKEYYRFDCAVIIRGGGARLDLAAFDTFELARAVAEFPLPVLSGIGHDVDQTVVDLVAHTPLKTPTAVADFLLAHNLHFESAVNELGYRLQLDSQRLLRRHQLLLQQAEQVLRLQPRRRLAEQLRLLGRLDIELPRLARRPLREHSRILEQLDRLVRLLSPEATLRRGFTLTLKDGKPIGRAADVQPGDRITTKFRDGEVESRIEKSEIESHSKSEVGSPPPLSGR